MRGVTMVTPRELVEMMPYYKEGKPGTLYALITNTRTPFAEENGYDKYIGELAEVTGNSYFGFRVKFEDGTSLDHIHFYYATFLKD